jgi:hypothetical protein
MDRGRRCAWVGCEKPLMRKAGETSQNFAKRRYCDKSCAAIHGNLKRKRRFNRRSFQAAGFAGG